MQDLFADLRFAFRTLARNRSFTFAALFSLAIGVGATTTVFTLVNAILFYRLPIADSARVVAVHTTDSRSSGLLLHSYPNYKDYRDQNRAFSSLLLYAPVTMNLTGRGDPLMLMGHLVSGNYFASLGVNPFLGRGFLPEEDIATGASPAAVLSYDFWRRQFGADPGVTSKTISLGGRPYSVVGVAPPGFRGLSHLYAADLWVPMAMAPYLFPLPALVQQRRALMFSVAGRLLPDIGTAQAEASLQTIAAELERQYPRDNTGRRIRLTPIKDAALPAREQSVASNGSAVLLIASSLVLLIACGNVASLLLARSAVRSKEISIRLALGAKRGRIVRQLLTESILLGVLGGAAGLLVARLARDSVWALRPPMFNRSGIELALDPRVLTFTFLASILTGVVFGLIPALRSTSTNLVSDLKERTGRPAQGGRWQLRTLLVSGQVAFSVVSLLGAGLFVRSVNNANRIEPGFDADRLGTVVFNVGDQGYPEVRGREYQQRSLQIALATPGVSSAALARDLPLRVSGSRAALLDGSETQGRTTLTSVVQPGYFQTMGIPLLRGRDFSFNDTPEAPLTAIVNESAAAYFWPGAQAIGKVLHFVGDPRPVVVVAVVRNANYQIIGEAPRAMIYFSLVQFYFPTAVMYVRTNGNPEAVSMAVRKQMQLLDRNLLLQSESFTTSIRESLWAQYLLGGLMGAFGVLAVLLSAMGIYGVISYSVNQRTREFGLRSALGGTAGQIQTMLLAEGLRPVSLGVVAGLLFGLGLSQLVRSMLYVNPFDAVTFILVPAILTLAGALACWFPCRRAVRVDPSVALRDE